MKSRAKSCSRAAATTFAFVLALSRVVAADPEPEADKPAEKKTYDNRDIDKARAAASEPFLSTSTPAPGTYTNTDLANLPDPTVLPASDRSPGNPTDAEPQRTTFTNLDLEPLAGAPAPSSEAPEEAEDVAARKQQAERELTGAQAQVDELEARLRAIRNPYLPRPSLPPEEEKAWAELDGAARTLRVEAQLEQARERLARAIEGLAASEPGAP